MDTSTDVSIIHLADLHIGSSSTRSAEYREIFDTFERQLNDVRRPAVAVIAGDIFHNKVQYSGQDIADFNYLISILVRKNIPTLIIPGNHDANLAANTVGASANTGIPDLISPLIRDEWTGVKYLKHTAATNFAGVDFYHISVFDESDRDEIIATAKLGCGDTSKYILLYHGMIDGAKFGVNTVSGSRINAEIVGMFRGCIAGDIHQRQIWRITSNDTSTPIAYCGSMVQQNLGEDMVKGYMVWSAPAAGPIIADPIFRQIPNKYGFVRLDLRGLSAAESKAAIAAAPRPASLRKLSVLSDYDSAGLQQQLADIATTFGRRPDNIIQRYEGLKVRPTEDTISALHELLKKHSASETHAKLILELHRASITESRAGKWHIIRMDWDDLLAYGPGNSIDFRALEGGISGVIAPNRAGKSSILDIMVLGLFGQVIRGDMKSVRRDGCKKAFVRVIFSVNGTEYSIERVEKGSNHGAKVTLIRRDAANPDAWENISGATSVQTYE
ncbi:MAG: metallophosphoesterase, partial [Castellaniella sp.]